jgi:hypothetical protein
MNKFDVNLENPYLLKYLVVIITDLTKTNPAFKNSVIKAFEDFPENAKLFTQDTSWNDSHELMFYINRNLEKFKNFLLGEYLKDSSLFSLEVFDKKYGKQITYFSEFGERIENKLEDVSKTVDINNFKWEN